MKTGRMIGWVVALAVGLGALAVNAAELKNDAKFTVGGVPGTLVAKVQPGASICFTLEENCTTGYEWAAKFATNECAVVIDHRGADTANNLCGAPGKAVVKVTRKAASPQSVSVELAYRRAWEPETPAKRVRLVLEALELKAPEK